MVTPSFHKAACQNVSTAPIIVPDKTQKSPSARGYGLGIISTSCSPADNGTMISRGRRILDASIKFNILVVITFINLSLTNFSFKVKKKNGG